jgi:hypothetical protein
MSKVLEIVKAVVNGDFQTAIKSVGVQTIPLTASTYRGDSMGNGWSFSTSGGINSYFKYQDRHSCTTAYDRCPGLNAVINKKAQAFINGEVWVLDNDGKVANGIFAKQLRKLLDKPNLFQSWDQFQAQQYIYIQTYGFCPMLAIKPEGYKKNIDASSLWNIPPTMFSPHMTGKMLRQTDIEKVIDYVDITFNGETSQVSIKDICILKDLTTSTTSPIFPDSRIKSLEMPINNQIGAYESRNVLINYRGALGIFSRDLGNNGQVGVPPITDKEKENLQKDFKRYGIRNNQWQFIITSAALKWQQVSVATKDLMLFEEVKSSNEAICDKYSYPFELLANEKGTTFDNRTEAGKDLYQNAIIPEALSIYKQLNVFFETATYDIKLDVDYSKVPCLQENEKARMEARLTRNEAYKIEWDNDLITRNQWRIANGEDPIEGDDFRRSEIAALTKEPLVNSIGVGGVQGIVALLTTPGIQQQAMQATLEIVFGLPPADAARMAVPAVAPVTNQTQNNE